MISPPPPPPKQAEQKEKQFQEVKAIYRSGVMFERTAILCAQHN